MNAGTFYVQFDSEFGGVRTALPQLKRSGAKSSKWRMKLADGGLEFAFATNFKTAGLPPQLPGEFRLRISWTRSDGEAKKASDVSLFQYTSGAENAAFAALQRTALEKYLAQPGKERFRDLYGYASDPAWLPRPNIEEWCYYFDTADARGWGAWYRGLLPAWIERFVAFPEANDDWAWRVLWPHLKREK